jgi:hypothetical protein
MMSFTRIVADGLFKSKVLPASPQIEVADRGLLIRASENSGTGNCEATPKCKGVSRVPIGSQHGSFYIFFRAYQGNVERISGDVTSRASDAWNVVERGVASLVSLPDCRYKSVGECQIH